MARGLSNINMPPRRPGIRQSSDFAPFRGMVQVRGTILSPVTQNGLIMNHAHFSHLFSWMGIHAHHNRLPKAIISAMLSMKSQRNVAEGK
jgi:hypothetical protein